MSNAGSTSNSPLTTNGLVMPADFPATGYEAIHKKLADLHANNAYSHFAGAWNGISYRFNALADCDQSFTASIVEHGPAPSPVERYGQERDLFGFFSNAFSTFESFFYGAFAAGALLDPTAFPLGSPAEQQQVTPKRTIAAYKRSFAGDQIVGHFESMVVNPAYSELREIRNVLTHRSAPGRTIHLSVGAEETPPGQWKLANIVLNESTTGTRRRQVSSLLTEAFQALQMFVEARF